MANSIRERAGKIVDINDPYIRKAFQIAKWGKERAKEVSDEESCYRGLQILGIETGEPVEHANKWLVGSDASSKGAEWYSAALDPDVNWSSVVSVIDDQRAISERYDRIEGDEFFNTCGSILESVQAKVNEFGGSPEIVVGEVEIVKNVILIPLIYIQGVSDAISIADVIRRAKGVTGKKYNRTSLLHEIAHQAAYAFSRTLHRTNRGVDTIDFRAETLIREAASTLMAQVSWSVATVKLYWEGKEISGRASITWDLFDSISNVARQTYEGKESRGSILFTQPDMKGTQQWKAGAVSLSAGPSSRTGGTFETEVTEETGKYVRFDVEDGIKHNQQDAIRKLLETAQQPLALLSDGIQVFGLKSFPGDESGSRCIPERFLHVLFRGGPNWELRKGEEPIMAVSHDQPRLPKPKIDKDALSNRISHVFGDDADVEELWKLVDVAVDQPHGTMVVISENAVGEADRLDGESTPIQPQRLEPEYVMGMTAIDGALMVDPEGICTAIGVILDGRSDSRAAEASKGARHNAAYRYRKSMAEGPNGGTRCLIIIVSEDGPISFCAHERLPEDLQLAS